ncbi:MAG: BrnT family toxin [Candidatus Omnitrophota bacterium]|jgi:uncharacterized DUF497 family protein|nr:MAG: BrnT family toxin [Candidatus Omnitrophota bacterium]
MNYQWDKNKAQTNLRKHGIRFADAVSIFQDDNAITVEDTNHGNEERYITIGSDAFGQILVVVYTWRSDNIRLISARKAKPRERRQYEGHYED